MSKVFVIYFGIFTDAENNSARRDAEINSARREIKFSKTKNILWDTLFLYYLLPSTGEAILISTLPPNCNIGQPWAISTASS